MTESGVQEGYFSILDGRHDVLVEAEVERMTDWLVSEPGLVAADALSAERGVAAGADQARRSWVRIFRLPEQSWTQIYCSRPNMNEPFDLAAKLSNTFGTRSLQIDLSEEGWKGYLLFDRGVAKEASVLCVGCQFQDIAEDFGMPVPEIDEDDEETLYGEGDWFHSELRAKVEYPKHPLLGYGSDYEKELPKLARHLGFWVSAGDPVWDPTCRVERMNLLYQS